MLAHFDDNNEWGAQPPDGMSTGLIPRDFSSYPHEFYAPHFALPVLSDQEIKDRLAEQKSKKNSLKDLFLASGMKALDQNGQGYCWAYSTTSATMLSRLRENQPNVRLSGHFIGCLVKNYANQGGWNAQSMEFAIKNGIASVDFWKEKSMSRDNDKPEVRENALGHKIAKWWELSQDKEQQKREIATCCVLNIPMPADYNWWGHSVCIAALESLDPFVYWILNSWGSSWSDQGFGKIEGSKTYVNGCMAPCVTTLFDQ